MYKIYITLFMLIFVACKNDKSTEQLHVEGAYTKVLKQDGELTINVNEHTSFQPRYISTYEIDGKMHLAYLGKPASTIQLYDLENGKLTKEIPLGGKGDHSIGEVMGFYIHTLDSIFVLSQQANEIVIINSEGLVLRRYTPDELPLQSVYTFKQMYFLPQTRQLVYHWTPYKPTNKRGFFKNEPISFALDIDSGKKTPFFTYNGSLKDNCYGHDMTVWWSSTQIEDQVYYAMPFDPAIYSAKNIEPAGIAHSQFFSSISPMNEGLNDDDALAFYMKSNAYHALIADPYRNVFYRIVCHPTKNLDNKNYSSGKPFSIMILDKSLEKIGETDIFEENMHDYTQFFVTQNGLYISANNMERTDIEEDKLRFSRFILVE